MLWIILFIVLVFFAYFFIGNPKPAEKVSWGVNFSLKQTDFLGLDDRETYLAILDDLKAQRVKISVHWDLLEKKDDKFDFSELDWQVAEAEKRNVQVVLAIGMRTPRWPECHIPNWAINMSKEEQQENILEMIDQIVRRYKDSPSLAGWQVENESFLNFGACPWSDASFLKKEVSFIKEIDNKHPVIITESGELSLWLKSATIGDIVGVTTYKKVWQDQLNFYFTYPLPPVFYERRAEIVRKVFKKDVIGVELQAEPWCQQSIINASLYEQMATLDLNQFYKNVEFAQKTGINTFYFWGAEWWYWMKVKQNHPEFWEAAKTVIQE